MRGLGTGGLALLALGAAVATACAPPAGGAPARADDPSLRRELERVAELRVFFGHQSVGRDALDGLRRLAVAEGVPLRIVETRGGGGFPPATFAHAPVAYNSRPDVKLESFARALDSAPGPAPDVALLKLCYVDVRADTDVGALHERYRRTLSGLRERHPGTVFVHVTVPLTARATGVKAWLSRQVGRRPAGLAENARREEYNALLREAYAGREPLFDLAALESTRPDGRPEREEWQGLSVPVLVPGYSSDGGHLDDRGAARVARALVALLAALPPPATAPTPPRTAKKPR